jgi:hypothetical protein
MPIIKEYIQQYSVGGEVGGRRATAEDMGGGFDFSGAGKALGDVAEFMQKHREQQEESDAQIKIMESRSVLDERIRQLQTNATPGVPTTELVQKEFAEYYKGLQSNYKTPGARKYVTLHGMSITQQAMQESIRFDVTLAAKDRSEKYSKIIESQGNRVFANPDSYKEIVEGNKREVEQGVGIFKPIGYESAIGRQQFMEDIEKKNKQLAIMAGQGAIESNVLRTDLLSKIRGVDTAGKSPEEIKQLQVQLISAAAEGRDIPFNLDPKNAPDWWKDLDAPQRDKWVREAIQRQKQEESVTNEVLSRRVDDAIAFAKEKGAIPRDAPRAEEIANPFQRANYVATMDAVAKTSYLKNAPIADQQAYLKTLEPVAGGEPGMYEKQVALRDYAAKQLATWNKQRMDDPMGTAQAFKFSTTSSIVPITNFADPVEFTKGVQVRDAQASAVSQSYGTSYKPLTNGEAAQASAEINRMDRTSLSNWLTATRRALPQEKYMAMMQQIAPNDGALLAASSISYSPFGGDKARPTSDNILRGREIINANLRGEGQQQEKGTVRGLIPNNEEFAREFSAYIRDKGIIGEIPQSAINRYIEASAAHYVGVGKANPAANLEFSGDLKTENKKAFHASIEAVMGTPTKIGSNAVIRPFGMDEDQFLTRTQSIVAEKTKAFQFDEKSKPTQLQWGEYSLSMVDGGRYQLVVGGRPRNIFVDQKELATPLTSELRTSPPDSPRPSSANEFGNLGLGRTGYEDFSKGFLKR